MAAGQPGPSAASRSVQRPVPAGPGAPGGPALPWRWIVPVSGGLLLWLHALRYHPFISDDALISLRYARRLLDGHGLTWTAGPPVEGYSNLLWVLACAGLGGLGLDLILAARLLGYALAAAALWAVGHTLIRRHGVPGPALFAVLALALCGPLAVWAGGGLEQPLLAALLAWAVALGPAPSRKLDTVSGARGGRHAAAAILLALVCLTRPDGVLLAAALLAGWFLAGAAADPPPGTARPLSSKAVRWPSRSFTCHGLVLPGAAVIAAVAGQTTFRLWYYGDWLPNPAYIKLGITWQRLLEGTAYVGGGLVLLAGLSLPALAAVFPLRAAARSVRAAVGTAPAGAAGASGPLFPPWRSRLPFILPLAAWLAYVACIGGDVFPARRHFAPAVVFLALLAGDAWARLRLRWRRWPLAAGALLLALGASQAWDPENRRALGERWEWDGQLIGELLAAAFQEEQPLLAVDPAGCLPYFSGLPALDMLGLNDREIARNAGRGAGWLGHEAGDGGAVLAREPDLVLFCDPAGAARPCFRSGREMVRDPRFHRDYRLVTFQADEPRRFRSRIWVRTGSERIGIRRTGEEVTIPGYLLASRPGIIAHLEAGGELAAVVPGETEVRFGPLPLPAGTWRLRTEPPWPGGRAVRRTGMPGSDLAATASESINLNAPSEVEIILGAVPEPSSVQLLSLEPLLGPRSDQPGDDAAGGGAGDE